MFCSSGEAEIGQIRALSVSGRGFTPEELSEAALTQIIHIGNNSDPIIREQAQMFRDQVRQVLINYGRQCVASNKTTIANKLRNAGQSEVIRLLED